MLLHTGYRVDTGVPAAGLVRTESPPSIGHIQTETVRICESPNGAVLRGAPSPRSYSAVLSGETLNTSSPTAVAEIRQPDRDLPIHSSTAAVDFIRQPDDDQTPTLVTAETRSLSAHGVATSLPSGSTPAGDDAALGGLNVSNVQNFMSQPSNPNEPASSFAPESCQAALAHTTKPASGRADFFRSACDKLPPIHSSTAAVEFIRQPDDDQTPTLVTAETRSLSAHGVATSLPSGSTPAGDDAALGGLNVSNVQNFMSQPSNPNEPASSFAPESCQAALAHTTKPASGRADFFRYVYDNLPPNAATPLPFTAMELLDLHLHIWIHTPRGRDEVDQTTSEAGHRAHGDAHTLH